MVAARASDAASEGDGREGLVQRDATERNLLAHSAHATANLKDRLQEDAGIHEFEGALFERSFEAVEVRTHGGEFLFVGGEIFFLELLELEMLEEMDFVLMFIVPLPEGGFGDVDLASDAGKAPAVGAEGDEGGKFGRVVHRFCIG